MEMWGGALFRRSGVRAGGRNLPAVGLPVETRRLAIHPPLKREFGIPESGYGREGPPSRLNALYGETQSFVRRRTNIFGPAAFAVVFVCALGVGPADPSHVPGRNFSPKGGRGRSGSSFRRTPPAPDMSGCRATSGPDKRASIAALLDCRSRKGLQSDFDLRVVFLGVPHVLDGHAQCLSFCDCCRYGREGVKDEGILPRQPQDVLYRRVVRQGDCAAAFGVRMENLGLDRCREEVF